MPTQRRGRHQRRDGTDEKGTRKDLDERTGGGGKRVVGRIYEDDLGKITRPKKNANSHTFPTNEWIHKITKRKESDRCDLCKTLGLAEGRGRFKTEKDLPEQNLGHIQHT